MGIFTVTKEENKHGYRKLTMEDIAKAQSEILDIYLRNDNLTKENNKVITIQIKDLDGVIRNCYMHEEDYNLFKDFYGRKY